MKTVTTEIKILFGNKEPNVSAYIVEMLGWLHRNIHYSRWSWHWSDMDEKPTFIITFINEEDALMFKIMFSGIGQRCIHV